MWFKNILIYRFVEPFTLSEEEFMQALEADALKPCSAHEYSSYGWVPPGAPEGVEMARAIGGKLLFCLGVNEKILPPGIVREAVREQVGEIELRENRKVSRSEKGRLTEQLVAELLPRALVRKKRMFAMIDPQNGWLIVDQSSVAKAEELTERLRTALGTLQIVPVKVEASPSAILTDWVLGGYPTTVVPANACELVDPADVSAVVRVRGVDLSSSEVAAHIQTGKRVQKLSVCWNERITCEISDAFEFRKIRLDELTQEEADDQSGETALDKLDADFAIMARLFELFITEMLGDFGGVAKE
jgi:recombination associated protein RdgC